MTESQPGPALLAGRTAWARSWQTPLPQFLLTETGSAVVLLAATVAALAWANAGSQSSPGASHHQGMNENKLCGREHPRHQSGQ